MPTSSIVAYPLVALLTAGAIVASASSETQPQPGLWQPGGVFADVAPSPQRTTSRFLLLDTGGSGGMFGQGDLREDLRDVAFWEDGRHGVASGKAGAFFTDDGGLTWRRVREHPRQAYPNEKTIRYDHVELSGPGEIWLVETQPPAAARHLWHSSDAGVTWEDAAARLPGTLESVWDLLARGNHIWVLGGRRPESSFRSEDGGRTWVRMTLPKGFEPYKTAVPASEALDVLGTVYLLGAGRHRQQRIPRLLRSDDAGRHWRELALPDASTLPWAFNRATMAFATPDQGMIGLQAPGLAFQRHGQWDKAPGGSAATLMTSDGGANWDRRELPGEELMITALWQDPAEPSHAFAGVWNGLVAQRGMPRNGPALYETFDGGSRWVVALQGGLQVNAVFGLGASRLWAVGDRTGTGANDVVAIVTSSGQTQ